jgi:ATP-dependent DNA helicase RecG
LISKFFIELGWVEEIGSGVKNLSKFLPHYSEGNIPTFIEEDTFRTILPLKRYRLGNKTNQALAFLEMERATLPIAVISSLEWLPVTKKLAETTSEDNFLFALISSWVAEGTKLDRLRILTAKQKPDFERWKDTSLSEKGTKLYGKRMVVLMKVLVRLLEKTSMEELMTFMAYSNRKSFMDTYIAPLMEYNLVQRTQPDNPSHPEQKYVLTEKGFRFLGGMQI